MPLSTDQRTDCPVSLYAATKKSNELMAYTYGHLFGIPSTGLRFFTVYGPWGRPDMAYFSFTRDIIAGKPIRVFNQGDLYRDFTYIDDIVEGVVRVIDRVPEGEPPVKVYNIGNSDPVRLDRFIGAIETAVGKEAVKEYFPMQPGDVYKTYADVKALENDLGYHPSTPIETGIQKFVAWYKAYYHSS
jgi:UDP-glucuronate 4-epimerase